MSQIKDGVRTTERKQAITRIQRNNLIPNSKQDATGVRTNACEEKERDSDIGGVIERERKSQKQI